MANLADLYARYESAKERLFVAQASRTGLSSIAQAYRDMDAAVDEIVSEAALLALTAYGAYKQ